MFESVKAAAEANEGSKIIGVDVDQSYASELVITSAVKGLKESVQQVLAQYYAGKWDTELSGKTQNLGAADNATGLPIATSRFTTFTAAQYDELLAKIKNGQIVPDATVPADANNGEWLAAKCTLVTVDFE
jgi:basic membrane protein A